MILWFWGHPHRNFLEDRLSNPQEIDDAGTVHHQMPSAGRPGRPASPACPNGQVGGTALKPPGARLGIGALEPWLMLCASCRVTLRTDLPQPLRDFL